jgi:hypothetical protein
MSKKYTISGPEIEQEIIVGDGDMIVYDVCKIKDYEGGDYVPRAAKKMDYVVLPIGNQEHLANEEV